MEGVRGCPLCGSQSLAPVRFTVWGGFLGPYRMGLVHCRQCGHRYVGASGVPEFEAKRYWGKDIRTPLAVAIACTVLAAVAFLFAS